MCFLANTSIALDPSPDQVEPRRYHSHVLYGISPPVHLIDALQVVCSRCQGGYISDRLIALAPVGLHSESASLATELVHLRK